MFLEQQGQGQKHGQRECQWRGGQNKMKRDVAQPLLLISQSLQLVRQVVLDDRRSNRIHDYKLDRSEIRV